MDLSSSTRHLLGEIASWACVAVALGLIATHPDEISYWMKAISGLAPAVRTVAENTPPPPADAEAVAPSSHQGVQIKAGRDGHFRTNVEINGREVPGLIDTGASMVALTYDDAAHAGIFPGSKDFTLFSQTANGTARFAPVTLDRVSIGAITVYNVEASVSQPGALSTTLIGMSFLQKLQSYQAHDGKLELQD